MTKSTDSSVPTTASPGQEATSAPAPPGFNTPEMASAFEEFMKFKLETESLARRVSKEDVLSTEIPTDASDLEKTIIVFRDFLSHKFGSDVAYLDNAIERVFS